MALSPVSLVHPGALRLSGRRPHRRYDLVRRVVEVVRRNHVETRVADDLLAEIHIRALEAHDQRNLKANFLHRGDDALGDYVAPHDAAKNIDENALYVRVG